MLPKRRRCIRLQGTKQHKGNVHRTLLKCTSSSVCFAFHLDLSHAQAQKHTAIATLVYTNSRIHNNTTDSDGLKYTHINTGKQRSKQKTHTFNEEHCNTTRITRMPWKENTDLIKVSNYDLIKV